MRRAAPAMKRKDAADAMQKANKKKVARNNDEPQYANEMGTERTPAPTVVANRDTTAHRKDRWWKMEAERVPLSDEPRPCLREPWRWQPVGMFARGCKCSHAGAENSRLF